MPFTFKLIQIYFEVNWNKTEFVAAIDRTKKSFINIIFYTKSILMNPDQKGISILNSPKVICTANFSITSRSYVWPTLLVGTVPYWLVIDSIVVQICIFSLLSLLLLVLGFFFFSRNEQSCRPVAQLVTQPQRTTDSSHPELNISSTYVYIKRH